MFELKTERFSHSEVISYVQSQGGSSLTEPRTSLRFVMDGYGENAKLC